MQIISICFMGVIYEYMLINYTCVSIVQVHTDLYVAIRSSRHTVYTYVTPLDIILGDLCDIFNCCITC